MISQQAGIIVEHVTLPRGAQGRIAGPGHIQLAADLSGAAARCALAHQLIHLERGDAVISPQVDAEVEQETARRLVPAESVRAAATLGLASLHCLATSLIVTRRVVRLRLALGDLDDIVVDRGPASCGGCVLWPRIHGDMAAEVAEVA